MGCDNSVYASVPIEGPVTNLESHHLTYEIAPKLGNPNELDVDGKEGKRFIENGTSVTLKGHHTTLKLMPGLWLKHLHVNSHHTNITIPYGSVKIKNLVWNSHHAHLIADEGGL